MQRLNDFICLKAIFNEELGKAVEEKSYNSVSKITWENYAEEIEELSVKLEGIDVDYIYNEYITMLKNDLELARLLL